MNSNNTGYIDPHHFSKVSKMLREFFDREGFIEVHTQSRLSILSACEDPRTISTYDYAGKVYPLPQTGQMWLEYELLTHPDDIGFYTLSTSYRNEPNPIQGRHDLIFPMFEFEFKGDIENLVTLETKLLSYLGFEKPFYREDYRNIAKKYEVTELQHIHETKLDEDYGHVFFLQNFPNHTSPFWNMKQSLDKTYAHKVDVILHGIETIGSAERSTDSKEMIEMFHNISNGQYADTLHAKFGKKRVQDELVDFTTSHNFFPRVGGGIGITRLIRAMKLSQLI